MDDTHALAVYTRAQDGIPRYIIIIIKKINNILLFCFEHETFSVALIASKGVYSSIKVKLLTKSTHVDCIAIAEKFAGKFY